VKLYAAREVTDRLGISRQRLSQLMQRDDFPEPIEKLHAGYIWLAEDIERWITEHRPDRAQRDE
jgi:prophage regulatory protein